MFQDHGFTTVELVVVIVLLGLLAATAVPRFRAVDAEAHAARVEGVMASLESGISLFHAQWRMDGEPGPNTPLASWNNLRANGSGFPYGLTDRKAAGGTVAVSADCVELFERLLRGRAPSVVAVASIAAAVGSTTDFSAVADAPDCLYLYTSQGNGSGDRVAAIRYGSLTGELAQIVVDLP